MSDPIKTKDRIMALLSPPSQDVHLVVEDARWIANRIEHLEALEQRLRAASMDDFDRIAELEAELIQVRGLSAFRKDENERLRGDLEVMRLQRNATHCSRCPECSKEFVYSYGSGTEGKDDE